MFKLQFLLLIARQIGVIVSKYLLEIGTEELPYKFIPQAIEQLKAKFENFFLENKIKFNNIDVFATPRRLSVIVDDIANKQPDEEKILKGPVKSVAYDENGNLTPAGKGFLQKNHIDEKNAYIENGYLYAKVLSRGKCIDDLLKENVAQIVLKLQGPYFMRWGINEQKFSRPIRWIVSILDDKELPVQIVDVKSSRFSRGHRFSTQVIEINNPHDYIEKLKNAHVIVNQEERKSLITELAEKEAEKSGSSAYYDEELLDEVTYLCEYPVPVVCDFDAKYLDLPEKVTVTVMTSHQRYFPLYKDGKLINKFITITNYLGNDFSNVKAGNERVITARLEDAIFFFNEDAKKPFETYVEDLKGVTFQKNMGSVFDKTQRIIKLSKIIADKLNVDSETITRTALLCKSDLTTNLVFEFTELQGFIGADYARISGEDKKVVQGIKEHYFPLTAESELAEGIEGQVVGIADKLDTICAVFVSSKVPTGSSDPLGVRRAALGIIKTVLINFPTLNLSELIKKTIELLPKQADVAEQIEDFFIQRLINFRVDSYGDDILILKACSKNKNPLENLHDFIERVELVKKEIRTAEFSSIVESSNRILRILKEKVNIPVNPELFQLNAEKNLFEGINNIKNAPYEILFNGLVMANPLIEKFFEEVLVMDKDEKIKQNRLAMLTILNKKYDLIADFSALQM